MNVRVLSLAAAASLSLLSACGGGNGSGQIAYPPAAHRTIIMVWDGLRPDSINPTDTPNLYALQQAGVNFTDNHSTYPTFTMMNSSSFATGSFPKSSGFYGNTFWTPPQGAAGTIPAGLSAAGAAQDYTDPVFTEDYAVLDTLNAYYGNQLLLVKSLFATAQSAGLKTATVGKSGAAYLQDLGANGFFLDENTARPASFAAALQAANVALPLNITHDSRYVGTAAITLAANNGNPTGRAGYVTFPVTNYSQTGTIALQSRDSTDTTEGAPEDGANKYMMTVYINNILPKLPDLSLIWFRTPDNPQHGYGVNTPNAKAGLASQDRRLGELQAALKAAVLDKTTDIIVVSDHAHSTVSGPLNLYPLRTIVASTSITGANAATFAAGISNATIGPVAADQSQAQLAGNGYSFSGDVRSADILTYRGLAAFDGAGCATSAMAGLRADGTPVQYIATDTTNTLCTTRSGADGKSVVAPAGSKIYQAISATLPTPVASFLVPATLPANGIVVAANGGSDYFYLPSHNVATIQALVSTLQKREEFGAIFVDSRYGAIPGTLPMSMINLENATRQNNGQPDVVASFSFDENQVVQGLPGIEFESFQGQRGMHGSFSPRDVHNTLIAAGPSFKSAYVNSTPTGNVDVAPTVAATFGLTLPAADGRVINEALANPLSNNTPTVTPTPVLSSQATGLQFELPTDLTGATKDTTKTAGTYQITLQTKVLTVDGRTYTYFDFAKAARN